MSTKRPTDAFLAWRTVLSCKRLLALPRLEGGKAVRFFCVFRDWFGDLCLLLSLFFQSRCFKTFSGANFCFGCRGWSCVFFDSVLLRFLFYSLVVRSRKWPDKILFMSGLLFLGVCSLSLSFSLFSVVVVFLFFVVFKRESSGLTGHTPHRTVLVLFFFLFVPAALGFSPVLAVRPLFLAFCRGAILGPGRFLDSPGTYGA